MIIIDSGNTSCKIWIRDRKITKSYSEKFTGDEIVSLNQENDSSIIYSTVAPRKVEKILIEIIKLGFRKIVDVGKFVKEGSLLGDEAKGMGSDRILGMIGVTTFLETPLITVDCGTAVTVNLLKGKKVCAGGAIFAGYSSQIKTLRENTEGITFGEYKAFKKAIGKSTEEALQSGVLHSIAGGIILLKENFLKESGFQECSLVITGGDGEMVYKKLKEENIDCIFKNDLIKLGIEEVFKNMSEIQKEKYLMK